MLVVSSENISWERGVVEDIRGWCGEWSDTSIWATRVGCCVCRLLGGDSREWRGADVIKVEACEVGREE